MDTQSVTAVRPEAPEHFASCTETAIGRRVCEFSALYGPDTAVTLRRLTEDLDPYRGECHCFAMQLTRVEADLTVARKAQRAGHDKAAVIADLTARRDALRSVTA